MEHRAWALLYFRELTLGRASADRLRQERISALQTLTRWLVRARATGAPLPAEPSSAAQMLASGLLVGALIDRPADLRLCSKRAAEVVLGSS